MQGRPENAAPLSFATSALLRSATARTLTPVADSNACALRGPLATAASVFKLQTDAEIEPKAASTIARIVASLRSLKTWVQVWLVWMTVNILAGFAFTDEFAVVIFLAMAGSMGAVNMALLFYVRGLFRVHGVTHLPFLLVFIVVSILRLATDALGSPITFESNPDAYVYLIICTATFGGCFLFDTADAFKVAQGETYIMGSRAAAQAGASGLSVVIVADDLYRSEPSIHAAPGAEPAMMTTSAIDAAATASHA